MGVPIFRGAMGAEAPEVTVLGARKFGKCEFFCYVQFVKSTMLQRKYLLIYLLTYPLLLTSDRHSDSIHLNKCMY